MSDYSGVSVKDRDLEINFTQAELRNYKTQFDSMIYGDSTHLPEDEISTHFEKLGFRVKLEKEEIKTMLELYDQEKEGKFTFEAFLRLQLDLDTKRCPFFEKALSRKTPEKRAFVRSSTSTIVHSFSESELRAYIEHVNRFMTTDPHIGPFLPMDGSDSTGLMNLVKKGILLCKLINLAVPGTIDERAINLKENPNPWEIIENHNLTLSSAKIIGCSVVNVGTEDLAAGKGHLCLGLMAQIIKVQLLGAVNPKVTPEIVELMDEDQGFEESFRDILSLNPEQTLIRWINYHLSRSSCPRKHVSNLTNDLKDGEVYTYLLNKLDSRECDLAPLNLSPGIPRIQKILEYSARIGCVNYVDPKDLASGAANQGLTFVANLFQARHGLVVSSLKKPFLQRLGESSEALLESPEVQSYRMWIYSIGVDLGGGNNLVQILSHGEPLLQILSKLQKLEGKTAATSSPGQRHGMARSPLSQKFVSIEKCVRAVESGKSLGIAMVGIAGEDIASGNTTLVLGFVWQLMRHHMFSLLKTLQAKHEITENAILAWANQVVAAAGKSTKAESFKDKSLSSSHFFLDLLSAVEPRSVKSSVILEGNSDEEKAKNANYAISVARKLGCTIFQSPKDILEVRPKMMMMFVAPIMLYNFSSNSNTSLQTFPLNSPAPNLAKESNTQPIIEPQIPSPVGTNAGTPPVKGDSGSQVQLNGDTARKEGVKSGEGNPKITFSRSGKFTTPVLGAENFGVKLRSTPPKN